MGRILRALAAGLLAMGSCGNPDEGKSTVAAGAPGDPTQLLFVDSEFNDFHLTISPADWDSIIWDTMGDLYRHADLRWKDVTVTNVGVRPSGHSTRKPG